MDSLQEDSGEEEEEAEAAAAEEEEPEAQSGDIVVTFFKAVRHVSYEEGDVEDGGWTTVQQVKPESEAFGKLPEGALVPTPRPCSVNLRPHSPASALRRRPPRGFGCPLPCGEVTALLMSATSSWVAGGQGRELLGRVPAVRRCDRDDSTTDAAGQHHLQATGPVEHGSGVLRGVIRGVRWHGVRWHGVR